jgi:hypothetical protein
MSNKRARAAEPEGPEGVDNFKRISGIGPVVESRLHAAGILTFAQLAAASPDELFAHLTDLSGLSVERIVQQDWIGKARALSAVALDPDLPAPPAYQPYATFTVQLLLSEENAVRRTRLVHVQSGQEESWAGWDADHLVATMAIQAGLAAAEAPSASPPVPAPLDPAPLIKKAEAMLRAEASDGAFVRSDTPYTIALDLEIEQALGQAAPTEVFITVKARNLRSGHQYILGVLRTPATVGPQTLTLPGAPLVPGTYRLEAQVATYVSPGGPEGLYRGALIQVL